MGLVVWSGRGQSGAALLSSGFLEKLRMAQVWLSLRDLQAWQARSTARLPH